MKINAIGTDYAGLKTAKSNRIKNATTEGKSVSTGPSMISFKSGNPRHFFHQISELSLLGFGDGGVGTVGNDLFFLPEEDYDRMIENIPLYNQDVTYVEDIDPVTGKVKGIKQDGVTLRRIPKGLDADNPFKAYEGCVFATPKQIGKDVDLVKYLSVAENQKTIYILEDVASSKISWGLENEIPVGVYKLKKTDRIKDMLRKRGWTEGMINKIDITFTYVDATASMPKQYADGSYSSATGDKLAKDLSVNWQGKPYPKEAKATAAILPELKAKMGFDPKFIMCHDGQAMSLIHYVAEMNANGGEYWKDKVVTAIGHNLNDGYMYGLGTKDAIVALAKKGEVEQIINSREYKHALWTHKEDEFLLSLLPKEIKDGRGQINAVMFPIAYGEKGFVPMLTTVSDGYYRSIIENELISPALFARLKALSGENRFKGIMNVLMDPKASGFTTDGLQEYYRVDCKIKTKDGKDVTLPKFLAFDESKKYDLKHIREVKRQNKISLLKRLNNDLKGARLYDAKGALLDEGTGFSAAVTGGTGRNFEIIGGIDNKYIQMLEKNQDVPMFVSWGRGDFQKGMDTGLEAFVKYVRKTKDPNAIYVFGGDMKNLPEVITLVKDLEKDPQFKGRIVCINGWTPGGSIAAAGDYSALASRFAPCELTDLESMKKGCIPITPKVQGMDQKVFDPTDAEHAQFVNGYKGKHEYYMTEEAAFQSASKEEQEAFTKVKDSVVKEIKKDYKSKIGKDIPDDLFAKQLKENEKYGKALQKLRDSVISDDIAECMERAMKDRNTAVAEKIWKNHVDLKTTWKENGWLNPGGKSTYGLYKDWHFNTTYGKNLSRGQELRLDLSKLTADRGGFGNASFGQKVKNFFKSKGGKYAAGAAAAAAVLAGVGYYGHKHEWFSPKFEKEQKKTGELSCIG